MVATRSQLGSKSAFSHGVIPQNVQRLQQIFSEEKVRTQGGVIAQHGGRYQQTSEVLFDMLVPALGECSLKAGEPFRVLNKIVYDYYNNGWCNLWSLTDYCSTVLRWVNRQDWCTLPVDCLDFVRFLREFCRRDFQLEDECRVDTQVEDRYGNMKPSMAALMNVVVEWTVEQILLLEKDRLYRQISD